jgi:hypothetical protein
VYTNYGVRESKNIDNYLHKAIESGALDKKVKKIRKIL